MQVEKPAFFRGPWSVARGYNRSEATLNSQPSTLHSQPSTLHSQPSTLNSPLSTLHTELKVFPQINRKPVFKRNEIFCYFP